MPRVGFIGERITEEDRAQARRIRAAASGYTKNCKRYIEQLASFMAANDGLPNVDGVEALELFYGQYLRKGRSERTLKTVKETLGAFGVRPHDLSAARQRMREYDLGNGVGRLAAAGKKIFQRKALASALEGVCAIRPNNDLEAWRRAFWAMITVTGNRPEAVANATIIRADDEGLKVHWNVRKVRSDVDAFHQYAWSGKPPRWVIREWNSRVGRAKAWEFSNSSNAASAVNGWLERWKITGSSTSPRAMVDRKLRDLLRRNIITRDEYEVIIDHTEAVSLRHYVGDAGETVEPKA